MEKKSLALLLIASCLTSSAFATSFIDKFITKHHRDTSTVQKHTATKPGSYTDFSGSWMIDCGDGLKTSAVIENDERYITLDGEEFRIGQGLQAHSASNEEYTSSDHISFEWNKDGTELILKSVGFYKGHMDNSVIFLDISKATLTMKNGQINLDGQWAMLKDVSETSHPINVHCVFTKKQ